MGCQNSSLWRIYRCIALMLGACIVSMLLVNPPIAVAQQDADTRYLEELHDPSGVLRNVVSTIVSENNTIWIGPYLQRTSDGGDSWFTATAPELERGGPNRVTSLALASDTLVAGLATTAADASAAAGFLVSTNRGQTLHFRPTHLDVGTEDTLRYGINKLGAIPVTDPRQSPPFSVDLGPQDGEVWVAGGRSGVRYTNDFGTSWQRVILPPDNLDRISPDQEYNFTVRPPDEGEGHANFEAYSVLVDDSRTIWVGTSAGVNRSTSEDVFAQYQDARAWERIRASDGSGGLLGNLVVALAEQVRPGSRNYIWIASWPTGIGQQLGVSRTSDGGENFDHFLIGERVQDFSFRGDDAFVAANSGLFQLDADGRVTQHISTFPTPEQPSYEAPDPLAALAVEVTDDAIWVGTQEGLFRSTDEGETWRVFRAEVPTRPDQPSEDIPAVDTYAYPNPFSPSSTTQRFVVEVDQPQDVSVQIFDYAMNPVRELNGSCGATARCEVSWQGTDASGRQVAIGTYFYTIRADQQTYRGKIVVLE